MSYNPNGILTEYLPVLRAMYNELKQENINYQNNNENFVTWASCITESMIKLWIMRRPDNKFDSFLSYAELRQKDVSMLNKSMHKTYLHEKYLKNYGDNTSFSKRIKTDE